MPSISLLNDKLRYEYNKYKKKKSIVPNKYLLNTLINEAKSESARLRKDNIFNLYGRLNSNNEIDLKIFSLNVHGFSNNKMCLNDCIPLNDITVVNETWAPSSRQSAKQIEDKTFQVFDIPGVKTSKKGRHKGGLAFIVHSSLNCEFIKVGFNIGILLVNKLVIINTYLPYYISDTDDMRYQFEAIIIIILNISKWVRK